MNFLLTALAWTIRIVGLVVMVAVVAAAVGVFLGAVYALGLLAYESPSAAVQGVAGCMLVVLGLLAAILSFGWASAHLATRRACRHE